MVSPMSKARQLAQKPSQPTGRKNLIINGAMQVAQRGTSSTTVGAGTFRTDRFQAFESSGATVTVEQSTDSPDGFYNSTLYTVTTADTSLGAAEYFRIVQYIEAQNLQHLEYGKSTAKTLTLSFWVKSSKTGTYCATIVKYDNTRYQFVKEFVVSAANTWEYKTITISPDSNIKATAGAIDNNNGTGLGVFIQLANGSNATGGTDGSWSSGNTDYSTSNQVNWLDSTSNNFYLTGVQLEVGSTATEFEHRSFGEELDLCKRYYSRNYIAGGGCWGGSVGQVPIIGYTFPRDMRLAPTIAWISGGSASDGSADHSITGFTTYQNSTGASARLLFTCGRSNPVSEGCDVSNALVEFKAEL